jgi:hypothetical protein
METGHRILSSFLRPDVPVEKSDEIDISRRAAGRPIPHLQHPGKMNNSDKKIALPPTPDASGPTHRWTLSAPGLGPLHH